MIYKVKFVGRFIAWQKFAWFVTACASLGFSPAAADVIEVGSNGTATVYSGPTLFLGNTISPVLKPEPKAPAAAAASSSFKLIEPAYPLRLHPTLDAYVTEAATKYGVDPILVRAVAWQESRFRGSAISPKGAIGVMQLMPSTASWLGVDPYDPRDNIFGGVAYLSNLLDRFGGDVRLALAAYNAGPEAVTRHRGIPPYRETQNYVKAISERLSIR
ncbi:lytic transglycosylase domain-containing protein [Aquidulcibacter sp.]|uniref:lytic transglycosylase domain-containing protein n=1 Tax=Aquidulcibacter sp. TaxID=2052990 RepID=UPI0025C279AD|nr:lytic transglycosylase domain-containing protein [Aquidulcibacter sp.]MCA3695479.1 lytic transglycosylase domain-containing protein [Aquidulcibacter sp.]